MKISKFGTVSLLVLSLMGAPALAQQTAETTASGDPISQAAQTIQTLVTQLTERTETYPAFVEELRAGLVTIQEADERVAELIASLTLATTQLEDGSEVDNAIDEYLAATRALVAEAAGSPNQAIRNAIPALEQTATDLLASDRRRGELVIEARNLIRTLEQDQEAIAFFIRANQVQQAAALISGNIAEFGEIVANGNTLAASLLDTVER